MELRKCSQLRSLSVENNRITKLVIDLRALPELRTLALFGNPLGYLPELAPCARVEFHDPQIVSEYGAVKWHSSGVWNRLQTFRSWRHNLGTWHYKSLSA